jgi:polyisoprenoid-binding protein YceI
MKKIAFLFSAVAILAACNNSSDAEKATTTDTQAVQTAEGTPYTIDTATTSVTWTGSKPTGQHTGNFKVTEGTLLVSDNALAGGSFTINVASLTNVDLAGDAESKGKLEGHLKSPDFFDVAKFPTAKFVITSVEPYVADSTSLLKDATHLIKGNLTLKDSTKNISFPARVTIDANTAAASADFNIDRTLWGMNYKGPENPQDWVIRKEVNIKLDVKATKK